VASPRLILVVIEVADVQRSARLYREGFSIDLHLDDHKGSVQAGQDRWTSGSHAAHSWTDGAYLHFALYPTKGDGTTRNVQIGFDCDDLQAVHERAIANGAELVHPARSEPWGMTRYRHFDGNGVSFTETS